MVEVAEKQMDEMISMIHRAPLLFSIKTGEIMSQRKIFCV